MRENTIGIKIVDEYDNRELWADTVDMAQFLAFDGQGALLESELPQAEEEDDEERETKKKEDKMKGDEKSKDEESGPTDSDMDQLDDKDETGRAGETTTDADGVEFDYGPYIENFPLWVAD